MIRQCKQHWSVYIQVSSNTSHLKSNGCRHPCMVKLVRLVQDGYINVYTHSTECIHCRMAQSDLERLNREEPMLRKECQELEKNLVYLKRDLQEVTLHRKKPMLLEKHSLCQQHSTEASSCWSIEQHRPGQQHLQKHCPAESCWQHNTETWW